MFTLIICVLEMSHSKTGRDIDSLTGLRSLAQFIQADSEAICRSVHGRFLPNSFHPIIYR